MLRCLLRPSFCASSTPLAAVVCSSRLATSANKPSSFPTSRLTREEYIQRLKEEGEKSERRHEERMAAERAFYAQTPNKPAPLPENAFVPGKFGMRRRIRRSGVGDLDAKKVGEDMETVRMSTIDN